MPPPALFPELRELLKENPRRGPFEPLDNRTDVLVRAVGEEKVDTHQPPDSLSTFTIYQIAPSDNNRFTLAYSPGQEVRTINLEWWCLLNTGIGAAIWPEWGIRRQGLL